MTNTTEPRLRTIVRKMGNKVLYTHTYDSKRMDGGCIFYDLLGNPTSWVRSLYVVRNGKRYMSKWLNIYVTFKPLYTVFSRTNKKGEKVS